jgi:formate hydrogenlyase subunit 4
MRTDCIVTVAIGLVLSPLLFGIINRTKAFFAGRQGARLLQPYYDLAKLFRKTPVYSRTTSWVFKAGPVVGLASVLVALLLVPLGGVRAPISFEGDLILFAYILGLMRFFTVIAALDTGSSFEGMGASREVEFAALAEPAFLLGLASIARKTGTLSLSGMLPAASPICPELALAALALLVVFLCENARIPFDDPNTHLELTMIHEVMVLDHSGPDFGFILYSAYLKLWVLGAIIVGIIIPSRGSSPGWLHIIAALCGMFVLAMAVGIIESVMARLRLIQVPRLLAAAVALSALSFVLLMRQIL